MLLQAHRICFNLDYSFLNIYSKIAAISFDYGYIFEFMVQYCPIYLAYLSRIQARLDLIAVLLAARNNATSLSFMPPK